MSRSSPSSAQRAPMKTLGQRCCRSRTVARSAIPCHVPSWRRRAGKALAKSARTGIPSCAARLCNSELCGSCVGLSLRKILPRQRVATRLVWDLDRLLTQGVPTPVVPPLRRRARPDRCISRCYRSYNRVIAIKSSCNLAFLLSLSPYVSSVRCPVLVVRASTEDGRKLRSGTLWHCHLSLIILAKRRYLRFGTAKSLHRESAGQDNCTRGEVILPCRSAAVST